MSTASFCEALQAGAMLVDVDAFLQYLNILTVK